MIYYKIHIELKIQVRINYADSNVYQNPETSACADPPPGGGPRSAGTVHDDMYSGTRVPECTM